MSFKAVDWAFSRKLQDMGEKLVLIALAHCHNHETGRCYPSIQYIVEMTGGSRRTVIAKLDSLQAQSLIEIVPTYREDGSQTSNVYRLKLESGTRVNDTVEPDYSAETGGCKIRGGGVQASHGGGANGAPGGANRQSIPIDARARKPEENRKMKENTPIAPQVGQPLVRSRRGRSVPLEPSEDAKRMIQSFANVYGERFRGQLYHPDATKDVLAAQSLLASGVTPEEVSKRFDQCTRSKGWNCKRITTLPLLARYWNETGGELAQEQRQNGTPDKNPLGDEWIAQLAEEQRQRDLLREQRATKTQDQRGVECTKTLPT